MSDPSKQDLAEQTQQQVPVDPAPPTPQQLVPFMHFHDVHGHLGATLCMVAIPASITPGPSRLVALGLAVASHKDAASRKTGRLIASRRVSKILRKTIEGSPATFDRATSLQATPECIVDWVVGALRRDVEIARRDIFVTNEIGRLRKTIPDQLRRLAAAKAWEQEL